MCTAQKIHKFEEAGLGKAPFRFIGMEEKVYVAYPGAPPQPSGTCQYCGNGIKYCYWLQAADGKKFFVGSECIRKHDESGLKKIVSAEEAKRRAVVNAQRRKVKNEKAKARFEAAVAKWNSNGCESLKSRPHPRVEHADKTLFDYVEWMVTHNYANDRILTMIENA